MCYYSTTLPRDAYRDAKVGENLTLSRDHVGHQFPVADTDQKVVCVKGQTEVHLESLSLRNLVGHYYQDPVARISIPFATLQKWEGKPVSGRFVQAHGGHYDGADWIYIKQLGVHLHLSYFKLGTKLYTGPKKEAVKMETRLGLDNPSFGLDYKPVEADKAPTLLRTMGRIAGLCSVTIG